jgi:TolB protein
VFTVGVIYPQTPGAPPSPSGNAIIFVRNGQLHAINADGSEFMQLTNDPGRQSRPSRGGGVIAFSSDRDGNMEIYTVAANGTNAFRVTAEPAADTDPSWSWPADRLAFSSMRSGGGDIYVMRGDGSALAQVTSDPAQDRWPSWFPFGGRLVFASNRDGGDFDLFAQNVDGSALTQLTSSAADETMPVWSPDGFRIAYLSGGNVFVMSADGSGQRGLTSSGGAQSLSWSPEGSALVYSRGGDLYVIRAEGGSPVRITSGGATDTDPSWAR